MVHHKPVGASYNVHYVQLKSNGLQHGIETCKGLYFQGGLLSSLDAVTLKAVVYSDS